MKILPIFALFLVAECSHEDVPPPQQPQGITIDTLWTDTINYLF